MSEIEEGAKAVKEIAGLGKAAVENLDQIEAVGRGLLGPFGQAYGILTDIVAYKREEIRWRLANKLAIYRKAHHKLDAAGISVEDLRSVQPRIAYDYEEALEREDNPSLQELWSQLLVNTTSPKSDIQPRKAFKDILERLDEDTAALFNELGRQQAIRAYFIVCGTDNGQTLIGFQKYAVPDILTDGPIFEFSNEEESLYCQIEEDRLEYLLDELASIGIVKWDRELIHAEEILANEESRWPSSDNSELGRRILAHSEGVRVFMLTSLGREFWRAVEGVNLPTPPIE